MPAKLFQPGNSGRPKGASNKATKTVKEMFQLFCEAQLPKILKRADELTLKEQAQLTMAMASFILPKHQIIETATSEPIDPRYEKLTFDQLQRIQAIITGEPKLLTESVN